MGSEKEEELHRIDRKIISSEYSANMKKGTLSEYKKLLRRWIELRHELNYKYPTGGFDDKKEDGLL